MSTEIKMPKLGMTMTEGTVESWDKQVGEAVQKGESVCTISSEKLSQDIESPVDGILIDILVEEDETAEVGSVLALVEAEGEETGDAGQESEEIAAADMAVAETASQEDDVAIEPAAIAAEKPQVVASPGRAEEVRLERSGSSESSERIFITPLAKRMAKEKGLAINQIPGTGGNGRITKYDVLKAEQTQSAQTAPAAISEPQAEVGEGLPNMRKVIAENMRHSLSQTAQVTLHRKVDVDKLLAFRSNLKHELQESASNIQVSITALLAKAVVQALKEDSRLNARYDGAQLEQPSFIHIGIATALEEGLLVPVVKNAATKSIGVIAAEIKDLSARAREGTLSLDEMQGSTFSITNMGTSGVEYFTPILNYPEVGILGVGSLQKELRLSAEGTVAEHNVMPFSLTFDHQIIDGAVAAEFLEILTRYLEHPYLLII